MINAKKWALLIGQLLFDAFVGMQLWRWFFIPLGAPSIVYAHAVGLIFSVKWVILDVRITRDGEITNEVAAVAGLVVSAIVLAFSAALHWWMVRA